MRGLLLLPRQITLFAHQPQNRRGAVLRPFEVVGWRQQQMPEGHSFDQIRADGYIAGVKDVTIEVGRGEMLVIMGLSGSGKSTLVRHFNRLLEPTAGKIIIEGRY